MSMIVTVEWLKNRLETQGEDTVVVDARFNLSDLEAGRKAYEAGHIPQAVYLDLKNDLASPAEKHGGDNPLPDPGKLAEKLGSLGIDQDTTVVIYDETNDMFASRAWWVLDYIGLDHVYILDGGFKAWQEAGYEMTTEIPNRREKVFKPKIHPNSIADINDVKEKLKNESAILLDSRSRDRYLGGTEPMYGKSGHIPGAKNYFYKNVFNEDGTWKSEEQLRGVFASLPKDQEIIVSCGSGVSACPNIIGLKRAGYENIKLYPGSFSDWISYEENKVETKEE